MSFFGGTVDPNLNSFYSRSLMFSSTHPLALTGVLATYSPTERMTAADARAREREGLPVLADLGELGLGDVHLEADLAACLAGDRDPEQTRQQTGRQAGDAKNGSNRQ